MNKKMKIFYALGIIYNLWPLALLLTHAWTYALGAYGLMQALKICIFVIRAGAASGPMGVSFEWPILRYMETRSSKKIYHEMGEFWLYIEKRETQYRVVLSEQGYIIDDIITSECFYSLSPEKLSEWCKNAIDERYEKEMKEIRMMEEVNKWDGAVDQVSRRDKKLGDIGV